jgi:hypothetical protein
MSSDIKNNTLGRRRADAVDTPPAGAVVGDEVGIDCALTAPEMAVAAVAAASRPRNSRRDCDDTK